MSPRPRPGGSSPRPPHHPRERVKVDVGHAMQHRYKNGAKTHAVTCVDGQETWRLLCTGGEATREYVGWLEAIKCRQCQAIVRRERDDGCG